MVARGLTEQEPPGELPAEAQPVVDDAAPPVEPETDAPVDVWKAAYAELRRSHAEQAERLAQYEAPEPEEEWKPLKRGCGVCGLDYEWVRKRVGLGLFKTRRELTTRSKPGRIFIEVNSLSKYWQRTHAK
jgi:hypothetical protein